MICLYVTPDIDECIERNDDCHRNATCINNEGSFSCSCMSGLSGNGTYCEGRYGLCESEALISKVGKRWFSMHET